jgi:nucleotide-binding universal stress UspA family protein
MSSTRPGESLAIHHSKRMFPISRILVPVDFSERCLGMMAYVRAIAGRYKAEVILLHVVNPVYSIPASGLSAPALMPVPQWFVAEKVKDLETFAASELRGLPVRRLVYEGDPETQIGAFAQAENVNLVIIPTHGRGVLRRYLIGSVAAKVLHDVCCPVLTGVHMETLKPTESVKVSNIVCAIDLGPRSGDVLASASQLASDFEARLSLVHVIPSFSPSLYAASASKLREEWEEAARKSMESLQREAGTKGVSLSIHEGDVARSVCSFAGYADADLIVIGRGPHEETPGRLRTNAYAIIRHAPCPVLSV